MNAIKPKNRRSRQLLGIFAKKPTMGEAKTRLAEATTPGFAQRVAQAFLSDSLDRFENVRAQRAIIYAPAAASRYFSRLARRRYDCWPQSGGNLGQRLQGFFLTAWAEGMKRIVAIGTDSPTLPTVFIEQAFALLRTHDVVIGPACDGGYYLIGCGSKHFGLFEGIPWSSSRVLEETVDRLRERRTGLALLPPWYDVDTADDWAMLCGHIKAMRHAGIDPGVPRVERLIGELTSSRLSPS